MRKVVILDVAREAGVSRSTVSNFFNHPGRLSPDVAERVGSAVERLGYVRSDAARQLRAGDSNVIAYVMFELGNTYFSDVANAMERRAAEAGLFVMLGNNGGNLARELDYLRLFESQKVRGLIVAPVGPVDPILDAMRKRGIPSVITGREAVNPDQPSVSVENTQGGYLATKHLIAQGRTRLAFAGGPLDIRQVGDRFRGASQAVAEHQDVSLQIYPTAERTIEDGRQVGERILREHPERRPDGIFAVNDLVAVGLMGVLGAGTGVVVPDDIAVIGFDDLDVSLSGAIALSSVRTPHEEFGRAAVELLLAELGDLPPRSDKHVIFFPEIVARESTVGKAARTSA